MDKLLTVKSLAYLLSRSEGSIRNDLSRRPQNLPSPIRLGKLLRWRQCDIEQWIEELATEQRPSNIVAEKKVKRRRGRPTKAEQIRTRS